MDPKNGRGSSRFSWYYRQPRAAHGERLRSWLQPVCPARTITLAYAQDGRAGWPTGIGALYRQADLAFGLHRLPASNGTFAVGRTAGIGEAIWLRTTPMCRSKLCTGSVRSAAPASMTLDIKGWRDLRIVLASGEPYEQFRRPEPVRARIARGMVNALAAC